MSIFEHHLRGSLGHLKLDEIDVSTVQVLKAAMGGRGNRYDKPLTLKTCNNGLAVLSNALKYAEEVGLIDEPPRSLRTFSAPVGLIDPDERVIAMLGARSRVGRGNGTLVRQQYVVESIA